MPEAGAFWVRTAAEGLFRATRTTIRGTLLSIRPHGALIASHPSRHSSASADRLPHDRAGPRSPRGQRNKHANKMKASLSFRLRWHESYAFNRFMETGANEAAMVIGWLGMGSVIAIIAYAAWRMFIDGGRNGRS